MAKFAIDHVSIEGISACVPQNKVFNRDYVYQSPKEQAQFIKTTGIEERRIAPEGTTASDLCLAAARRLLAQLACEPAGINLLVFVSQTPDYKIPCTATILQDKLGLSKRCLAFDVNLGCSGYVYGLSIVASMLTHLKGKALLLVGDVSSTCVNLKDKTAAPLFSDAGSASLLSYQEGSAPMYFNLQSDGAGYDAIITPDGGARNPINDASFSFDLTLGRSRADMILDGIKVFNFSRREVLPNVRELLEYTGKDIQDISFFVFHQANKLMNDMLAKKLGIDPEQAPQTLAKLGNTSSASIPVTLVQSVHEMQLSIEKEIILSGFGVGLSWGSVQLDLSKTNILSLIEI